MTSSIFVSIVSVVSSIRIFLKTQGGESLFSLTSCLPPFNRQIFCLLLGVLFVSTSLVVAESPAPFTVIADIPYLGPERAEKMDVYLPPENFPRPLPALLFIHGGAWVMGDKAESRAKNIGSNLASHGIAVFSINYRLNKKVGNQKELEVVWPQNFYDCKSALRYLRKEAATYGLDPSRIGIMGASAGGHLALLVGGTAHVEKWNQGGLYTGQDSTVRCIIDFYGVPDLKKFGRNAFAGKTAEETDRNLEEASPINYIGKETPPILIIHGTGDKLVKVDISRDFVKVLEEKGAIHEYIEIPNAPHAFDLQPTEMDLRPAVRAFLDKYLIEP